MDFGAVVGTAGALSALGSVGFSPSGSPSARRVAMSFTSVFRLRNQGADANAFFGTTVMSHIDMAVNPNSIKFAQPKRIQKKDTRDSSVFFHFNNKNGQNNDLLVLTFSGNTGVIDVRGSLESDPDARFKQDTGALQKLLCWHNLYLLTREPMQLPDGTENVFVINYRSALFPLPIQFWGHYNRVLEFEESADKPNSRNYTCEFTVTSTLPSLDEFLGSLQDSFNPPTPQVKVTRLPPTAFQQEEADRNRDTSPDSPGFVDRQAAAEARAARSEELRLGRFLPMVDTS